MKVTVVVSDKPEEDMHQAFEDIRVVEKDIRRSLKNMSLTIRGAYADAEVIRFVDSKTHRYAFAGVRVNELIVLCEENALTKYLRSKIKGE